jgi:arylsulfatase A-like enzyme
MKKLTRHQLLKLLFNIQVSFFLVFVSSANTIKEPAAPKPNVIFVLADQWRAQATGYNGDENLKGRTPNLDRIAETGVNFTNAISVCPVCSPNRASLLTGQYPTTNGIFLNDLHLSDEALTMAEIYQESGYQTAYIGKWHLDGRGRSEFTPPERRQGFEYWKALECSHDYNHLPYYSGDSDEKLYWEGYAPYRETEDAIRYISQNAKNEKPFLLFLSWGAPHFPHNNAPEEMQKLFVPDNLSLPANVPDAMAAVSRKEAAGYYAHIAALDKCLGELQQAIAEAGISENTIFIFTSDHGEMMGSQGVRPTQKQVPWAESVRVPFLLQYPRRFGSEGIRISTPLNTPDILPTMLALSGIRVPGTIEGDDLTGVMRNPKKVKERAALIMSVSPFTGVLKEEYRGIYTSRYTYVESLKGPWLMYDNLNDPLQLNNLAVNPEFSTLREELGSSLREELKKAGDEFKPRDHYISKWGYKVNKHGYIDYTE